MAKLGRFGKSDDSTEEITPAPPRVFVSYRRDDSSGYAGRLYADLSQQLGEDNVFIDIDSLVPGADFVDAIEDTLAACDLVLVVIGRSWLSIVDTQGRRRLDNENDFVCMEVGEALERSIGVIPVLVGGAVMPDPEELPEKLVRLARRHAMELSDRRWPGDVNELLLAIHKVKDRRAVGQKDVDRIVQDSTTGSPSGAKEEAPETPRDEAQNAQTEVASDPATGSSAVTTEASHDLPLNEPSGDHVLGAPLMVSSTVSDSHQAKDSAQKPTQTKQQSRHGQPGWVLALRRHPWRVVGVIVLVAAGVFTANAFAFSNTDPLTDATAVASCVSTYNIDATQGYGFLTYHAASVSTLRADCQTVGDCYVNHLPGMTNTAWKAAQGNSADGATQRAIIVADQQCQKALPHLANLVDIVNPDS